MGKFKDFLTESYGLGDIGPRISRFVDDPRLGQKLGGALLSAGWTGSGSESGPTSDRTPYDPHLYGTDLTVPSVRAQGRILSVSYKQNPIHVSLSGGTELDFGYDEFSRIDGKPEVGKVMTVVFQRHPSDRSGNTSKIEKAVVTG